MRESLVTGLTVFMSTATSAWPVLQGKTRAGKFAKSVIASGSVHETRAPQTSASDSPGPSSAWRVGPYFS